LKKKTLQTNIAVNGLYDTRLCTLDSDGLTQSGVKQIIYRNVGLNCFFHSPKFLLLSLVFAFGFRVVYDFPAIHGFLAVNTVTCGYISGCTLRRTDTASALGRCNSLLTSEVS